MKKGNQRKKRLNNGKLNTGCYMGPKSKSVGHNLSKLPFFTIKNYRQLSFSEIVKPSPRYSTIPLWTHFRDSDDEIGIEAFAQNDIRSPINWS